MNPAELSCFYNHVSFQAENEFQRTLHYAISLGGDTDTIASMAGSIAGEIQMLNTIIQ